MLPVSRRKGQTAKPPPANIIYSNLSRKTCHAAVKSSSLIQHNHYREREIHPADRYNNFSLTRRGHPPKTRPLYYPVSEGGSARVGRTTGFPLSFSITPAAGQIRTNAKRLPCGKGLLGKARSFLSAWPSHTARRGLAPEVHRNSKALSLAWSLQPSRPVKIKVRALR